MLLQVDVGPENGPISNMQRTGTHVRSKGQPTIVPGGGGGGEVGGNSLMMAEVKIRMWLSGWWMGGSGESFVLVRSAQIMVRRQECNGWKAFQEGVVRCLQHLKLLNSSVRSMVNAYSGMFFLRTYLGTQNICSNKIIFI